MRILSLFLVFLASGSISWAQNLSGKELLDKAIAYHDPQGHWPSFAGSLTITMETPAAPARKSVIDLDLSKAYFKVAVAQGKDQYSYTLNGDNCKISLNGSENIAVEEKERLRLSCDRASMYRNYYTYLYGLPMKLKDPGTIIHEQVATKTFKGKTYLVLKATYEQEVGKDTWYFYFDPTTYAMEVYQFFHEEAKNDGEYILLEGLKEINGIKMPKLRKWYYNKDDKFLGADRLD